MIVLRNRCRYACFLLPLLSVSAKCSGESADTKAILNRVRELGGRIEVVDGKNGDLGYALNLFGRPATDQDMKLLGSWPQLRQVDISRSGVSGRGLGWLAENGEIEVLKAAGLGLRDRDLQKLGNLVQVVELSVADNPDVSGAGFRGMVFPRCRRLNLSACGIEKRSLRHLPGAFPRLEELRLEAAEFPASACRDLTSFRTLLRLDLGASNASDQHLAALAGLSSLEELIVRDTAITDRGLMWLAGATNLWELSAIGSQVTSESAKCFPMLRTLRIDARDDRSIEHLPECVSLEKLWLSEATLTTAGLRQFGRCGKLKELHLYDLHCTREGLQALWAAPQLEDLTLAYCRLPSEGLQGIEASRLHRLKLVDCNVTAEDIAIIATIPHLEELEMRGCRLSDDSVPHFVRMAGLKRLSLELTSFSENAIRELKTTFPDLE